MLPLETLAQEAADIAAGRLPGGADRQGAQRKVIPLVNETASGVGGESQSDSVSRARRETSPAVDEVGRVMQICNACRYCEGFCAVFPAMTNRLAFSQNDIHFLSNLCHNCGACLHACQYAPPHEFAVNVPKAMAEVRLETYTTYAWPAPLGRLYRRNGMTVACALVIGLAVFLMLSMRRTGALWRDQIGPAGRSLPDSSVTANFYAIFPHAQLAAMFGIVFLYAIVALAIGVRRFWRFEEPGHWSSAAAAEAAHDALTLRYLGGGHGDGCNNADDRFSLARRRFHHLTFYGFMLCFASTCVATLYHYVFGWEAPYALLSVPVALGTVGGVGLLVGPAGLLYLNMTRHPLQGDPKQKPMDRAFILLLMLVSATGLALLALRDTDAMGMLLAVHLGAVMALFLTLPYGKFAHGIFRSAALLKWVIEKRNPPKLNIGAD